VTAVERLEAAIAKLERLKSDSPGRLYTSNELLVTLHRTIDAQLDLLRLTRAYLGAGMTGPDSSNAFAALGGALADAIVGDNS